MSIIKFAGHTDDGAPVVKGVYEFCSTHGVPLDVVLGNLSAKNIHMDYLDFLDVGEALGESRESLKLKVSHAYVDVFNDNFQDAILAVLPYYAKENDGHKD